MERRSLDDVGSRYAHLKEMEENWIYAAEAIAKYSYVTEVDKEHIKEFEIAAKVLSKSIEALAQYNENEFRMVNQLYDLAHQISDKHSDMWTK